MGNATHAHIHFIYEVDNIPDHRSRQFGHCPCLLAVIKLAFRTRKKPHLSGNSDTANAKLTSD